MLRRDTADHNEEKKLMEGRERGRADVMKEKSRIHQRVIEAYNDLRKRSTARYAEYEASINLRDAMESQLRNQLQGVTDELHTLRRRQMNLTNFECCCAKRLSYTGTTMAEVTTHLHRVSVLSS